MPPEDSKESLVLKIMGDIATYVGHPHDQPPVLLTEKEAADILRIEPNTLTIWRADGKERIPSHKVGRLVRYRTYDIAEYLLKNRS